MLRATHIILFAFATLFAPAVSAETRDEAARRLEAKTKGASCAANLRELDRIPQWPECTRKFTIGSKEWDICANGVDRLNRAIFNWNNFVAKCTKHADAK